MEDTVGKKKDEKENGNGNGDGDTGQPGSGSGTGDGQQDKDVTMKQSAMDRLFVERADRAARKAVTDLLGKLGFSDADALTAELTEYKKIKDDQKSELEKLQGLKGQPDPLMLFESIQVLDGRIILCELGLPIWDIDATDLREGVEVMMASSFLFEAEGANMVFSY